MKACPEVAGPIACWSAPIRSILIHISSHKSQRGSHRLAFVIILSGQCLGSGITAVSKSVQPERRLSRRFDGRCTHRWSWLKSRVVRSTPGSILMPPTLILRPSSTLTTQSTMASSSSPPPRANPPALAASPSEKLRVWLGKSKFTRGSSAAMVKLASEEGCWLSTTRSRRQWHLHQHEQSIRMLLR